VATVVAEVRSISSRPVRRRGMKPLVEATVADATGVMKATFFNQPGSRAPIRPARGSCSPASTRHATSSA
jgi:ATP-dependent DNA helicase RecG